LTTPESEISILLPPSSHPNYRLWANYAHFAGKRGELVADILESRQPLAKLRVLDVGFGMGGTTMALDLRGATVIALESNPHKVSRLRDKYSGRNSSTILEGDGQQLNFAAATFDWVIFQDVLEHLRQPEKALAEAHRVLKPNGHLYISTPNRWSLLNLISDPHWNLPVVAALPRKGVEFFITKVFRREAAIRSDFAALFSLRKLRRWLRHNKFKIRFVNRTVAQRLFTQPTAVVNSDFHIDAVRILKQIRLDKVVIGLVNERFGLFNHVVNPTWYLIAQKGSG